MRSMVSVLVAFLFGGCAAPAAGVDAAAQPDAAMDHDAASIDAFVAHDVAPIDAAHDDDAGHDAATVPDMGTDAAAACTYDAPNDCASATMLTSIAGDRGADTGRVTGSTSEWVQVLVTESTSTSDPLSFTATLAPASGADFALYVYTGTLTGADCAAAPIAGAGTPLAVQSTWPDQFGADDSRWITIEVRYVGGTGCGAAATWTLTVDGHT